MTYYVLFFIQLETRRVCLARITPYPDQPWMEQQARNVTMKDWGFLGHSRQIPDSQEKSKNLLTEAHNRFLDIYDIEKLAECENYMSLAYWRSGELVEAETGFRQAGIMYLALTQA